MGGIDFNIVKDVGAVGILLLVILMIARGYLVPRKTVDSLITAKNEAIEFWKHAASQREQALTETIPVLKEIHSDHEVVVKLVSSLTEAVTKLSANKDVGR